MKRLFVVFAVIAILAGFFSVLCAQAPEKVAADDPINTTVNTESFASGSGSPDDPFLIGNINELQDMNSNLGACYALAADIDASATSGWNSGAGFVPVGNDSNRFMGSFNGLGHVITGLYINCSSTDFVGLFGCMGTGSSVTNTSLVDTNIKGASYIGGLVGYNFGSVNSSYVTGNVSGNSDVGGLVGFLYSGLVSNSHSTVNVSGGASVGGLVGYHQGGSLSSSYATGNVSATSNFIGGLVGYHQGGSLSSSYATGNVSGKDNVGGLVGYSSGGSVSDSYATGNISGNISVGGFMGCNEHATISNSSATGSVRGNNNMVGGLVGHNYGGSISYCYATGKVNGTSNYVGGLVGANTFHGVLFDTAVSNSYATGNVSGIVVGGLVGYNSYATVSNSYATGNVSGNSNIGGLVGFNNGGTTSNSFWDMQTSGRPSSAGGTGKNSSEMQSLTTFSDAGWGVAEDYVHNINDGYPYLSWQVGASSTVWYIYNASEPFEVWIDDDYNASSCGGHTWGYDAFNKIQDGIDAVSGSTVHVAAGTYYENIVLKDGVELLGAGNATTIIDGMRNGSAVTAVDLGNTTVIDGFAVINGSGTYDASGNGFCGGGLFDSNSSLVIADCVFRDNVACCGGGMWNNNNSSPYITRSTFWNNSALLGGGAIDSQSSSSFTDCIFWNNSASMSAGGLLSMMSDTVITSCTFWNNSASIDGAIANVDAFPIITNCIFWNDSITEITNYGASVPVITYCDVQGGYSGAGNIDLFPGFINPGAGDFHLGSGSRCIDAGNNSAAAIPAVDFEGDTRIWPGGGIVDIGADERVPSGPAVFEVWVDDDYINGSCGGHSWGIDAFSRIQYGIDNVSAPGTVHVAGGTYYENVMLRSGIQLLGAGNTSTVIDGGGNGSAVIAIYVGSSTRIDGFTITHGTGTLDPVDLRLAGGGMYNSNSSPAVSNCVFEGNTPADGGGMFNMYSSPNISNCYFRSNEAAEDGGGICNLEGSSPAITSCIFESNIANKDGGGIFNAPASSSPTIVNCVFWNNSATGLAPTSFDDGKGGGIYNYGASPIITNCDFIGNSAVDGGAIRGYQYAAPVITNCIIWGNSAPQLSGYVGQVVCSDVQGSYPGGNIDIDPLFVNASAGDFHLNAGSPCIDAGYNSAFAISSTDYEGDSRIFNGIVDMGADEFVLSITFPDPGLEAAVRDAISKPIGNIYQSDLDALTYLDAQSLNISDLTGLEHCTNLSTLYLSCNLISNISALSGLASLQDLSLNNNQVSNISVIAGLTNLLSLFISLNNISDISPLSGLTDLQWLQAEENQITDISSLAGLVNLQKLYLGYNQIGNLSALSSLTNLQWLYLWGNGLSNISALSGLTTLQALALNDNQISNISALSNLTGLQGLYLGDNQLSDITMISNLSNLQHLSLGNNQISNISALSGLNNLESLNINDNRISDMNALSGLSSLLYLDLQNNRIEDISAVAGLVNLQYLKVSDNEISDINALSGLAGLQHLFCSRTDISDLSALSVLSSLRVLEAMSDQIVDLQPLVNNSGLASGDFMRVGMNPLSLVSVNTYIPALQARDVTVYYTAPAGFYGDANGDGEISLPDYAAVRNILLSRRPFNPGADANRDGDLSLSDYAGVRNMLLGRRSPQAQYQVSYNFSSGAESDRWAKSNSLSTIPPALSDNFDTDSDGWVDAGMQDYINISSTNDAVWTIAGTPGNFSALQCKFTIGVNPEAIVSIGVTLNGSVGPYNTSGYCAIGCPPSWVGDGYCDSACNQEICSYDGGDCSIDYCAPGCPDSWIGDGYCDSACNTANCSYDGGDCGEGFLASYGKDSFLYGASSGEEDCAPGCAASWLGDGYCDTVCDNAACNYDAGDCGTVNTGSLELWAWNFNTSSWRQIGSDFTMTSDIASYSAWTALGKVYADYMDGGGCMYILANLTATSLDLNVDYVRLSVAW